MAPTPHAFFEGQIVPLEDAKVGVITHAFNYGTAVFEGIRANWSEDEGAFMLFRPVEHYERLRKSAHILMMKVAHSDADLVETTKEVVRRSGYREDLYIRPMVYKSEEVIGVRLHNVAEDLLIYTQPFGPYLDVEKGIRCCTSTWRRTEDTSIPVRAKVTGVYVNSALAKTEAVSRGFDEAVLLNPDGHVSEGSGENIFMIANGKIYTPPSADNILVGITRATVMELAQQELGIEIVETTIDRSELYIADEVFMTGTAAHVTPVWEIDERLVGPGSIGPITAELQRLYFQALQGQLPKYRHWVTPVPVESTVRA